MPSSETVGEPDLADTAVRFQLMIRFPRLYAILDSSANTTIEHLLAFAHELVAGGCTLLQYRNKSGNARVMLEQARELRNHFPSHPNSKNEALEW